MGTFAFPIGLGCGLFVGNMLIYKFLWGRPWADAVGIGLLAGVIGFLMMLAVQRWSN